MANTLLTNNVIEDFALENFKNELMMTRTIRRQYEKFFDTDTGRTIRIRQPVRMLAAQGRVANLQNIEQRYTDLKIDQRLHVAINLTDEELSLELNDFNKSVMVPAMRTLANAVDSAIYARCIDVYNYVGTAQTAPATYTVINQADSLLNSLGVPKNGERYLAISNYDGAILKPGLTGFLDEKFVDPILRDANIGKIAGFQMYEAQNVQRPYVTTVTGTPLVNGANQTGNSLVIDGVTANQIINKGTVFNVTGINQVNALSKTDTRYGTRFVVTSTVQADGSGNVTLPIYPAIEPIGQYQNVTGSPADNAAVTFQIQHTLNIAYHRDFMTAAFINLYAPKAAEGAYSSNIVDTDSNLALRMTRQFNAVNMTDLVRFDVLFGLACFPEYATRVMGS